MEQLDLQPTSEESICKLNVILIFSLTQNRFFTKLRVVHVLIAYMQTWGKNSQSICSNMLRRGNNAAIIYHKELNFLPSYSKKMDSPFSSVESVFCCVDRILLRVTQRDFLHAREITKLFRGESASQPDLPSFLTHTHKPFGPENLSQKLWHG